MADHLYFYGGLDTVGGVHMLFTSGNTGVLCDAGIPHQGLFTAPFIHLNEPIKPLEGREIRQYLLSRTAPPLLDLYKQESLGALEVSDLLKVWNRKQFPEVAHLYVFITHIHQDHIALLPYLHEEMTVFMHQDAYSQYQALVSSGYYHDTDAKIETFGDETVIDLEDIRLTVLEVDHMTPGTSGFILETKAHKLAYTADWRMSGLHPSRMKKFINTCQTEEIDVLITETTKVKEDKAAKDVADSSETTLLKKYEDLVTSANSIIYLLSLPMNLERIAGMIEITKRWGKHFVMEEKIAAYWHDALRHGVGELKDHPSITDMETIKVLRSNGNTHLPYENINVGEVSENKKAYVVHLNYASLPYLIEFEQLGNRMEQSTLIHANAPVHQDYLQKWVDEFQINYHNISNSGHASHEEISNLIEEINPNVVIPVHGKRPDLLDTRGVVKYLPTYGERINIAQIIQNEEQVRGV